MNVGTLMRPYLLTTWAILAERQQAWFLETFVLSRFPERVRILNVAAGKSHLARDLVHRRLVREAVSTDVSRLSGDYQRQLARTLPPGRGGLLSFAHHDVFDPRPLSLPAVPVTVLTGLLSRLDPATRIRVLVALTAAVPWDATAGSAPVLVIDNTAEEELRDPAVASRWTPAVTRSFRITPYRGLPELAENLVRARHRRSKRSEDLIMRGLDESGARDLSLDAPSGGPSPAALPPWWKRLVSGAINIATACDLRLRGDLGLGVLPDPPPERPAGPGRDRRNKLIALTLRAAR